MKTIEQALEEQIRQIANNYENGRIEFGNISMQLIRNDCGINPLTESKESRKPMIAAARKIAKKYGLKLVRGNIVKAERRREGRGFQYHND